MPVLTPFTDRNFPPFLTHEYRIGTRSRVIYVSVILSLFIAFTALPFINIPVSVQGEGVLQAEMERFDLVIPVNGKYLKVLIKDNQKVTKGDTLLLMDASLAVEQARILDGRAFLLEQFLKDIKTLLGYPDDEIGDEKIALLTGQYNASWKQFLQELREKKKAREQSQRIFNRYNYLYNNKALTLSEFERSRFEFDQAVSDYLIIIKQYRFQWESDAIVYGDELKQLKGKLLEIDQQRNLHTIISPCTGSIQNLMPLEVGGYAFANQKIGEISPAGALMAYCYIKPPDIGTIRVGQRVSFQVDAFNYNKWGLLFGEVDEISDDVIRLNEIPVFKVKCRLDNDHFQLAGSTVNLKKGMNVRARFDIGDRNLLQLLRDGAEDLVDPDFKKHN